MVGGRSKLSFQLPWESDSKGDENGQDLASAVQSLGNCSDFLRSKDLALLELLGESCDQAAVLVCILAYPPTVYSSYSDLRQ